MRFARGLFATGALAFLVVLPARDAARPLSLHGPQRQTKGSVALLWRDGALDPSDPIARFVDGLPAWGQRVTIDHLVHHTAGLPPPPYGPDGLAPEGVPAWSRLTGNELLAMVEVDADRTRFYLRAK